MSLPNPFSTSNASQHNLIPKIVNTGVGFGVAVDLVDIDTVRTRQIGSPDDPVDIIYANNLFPPPSAVGTLDGGTGINLIGSSYGYTIESLIEAGSGITLTFDKTAYVINNTRDYVAGPNVTITRVDQQSQDYPFGYYEIAASGGGETAVTGPSAPEGVMGNVPYLSSQGTLVTNDNFNFDENQTGGGLLYVPELIVQPSLGNSVVKIRSDGINNFIESGSADSDGAGNLLNIQSVSSTTPVVTVDTVNSYLGINTQPNYELDITGQTQITYNSSTPGAGVSLTTIASSAVNGSVLLSGGNVYRINAWGGGGAANGSIGGGGGYVEFDYTASVNGTLGWGAIGGGAFGGGVGQLISFNGATIAIVGGGGAGMTGSTGGGGGGGDNAGALPLPEGGDIGGGTVSTATYVDTNPWTLYTSGGTIASGATFSTGTLQGLVGNVIGGMTLSFSNAVQFISSPAGTTFTLGGASISSIEANNISFPGATFTATSGPISLASVTGVTFDYGTAGATGAVATATYNNWDNQPTQVNIQPTFSSGTIVNLSGPIAYNGTVSVSGIFVPQGQPTTVFIQGFVNDIIPNTVIFIHPGSSITVNNSFGLIAGATSPLTITVAGTGQLPNLSSIGVASRTFINRGAIAALPNVNVGAPYGGSGNVGGGSPALVTAIPGVTITPGTGANRFSGGGGGTSVIAVGSSYQLVVPGKSFRSYINDLNPLGVYGRGGYSGSPAGSMFFVVQQKTTSAIIPPALIVKGRAQIDLNSGVGYPSLEIGGTAQNSIVAYGRVFAQALCTEISAPGGNYGYTSYPAGNSSALTAANFPLGINSPGAGVFGAGLTVGGGVAGAGLTVTNGITVSTSGGNALTVTGNMSCSGTFTAPSFVPTTFTLTNEQVTLANNQAYEVPLVIASPLYNNNYGLYYFSFNAPADPTVMGGGIYVKLPGAALSGPLTLNPKVTIILNPGTGRLFLTNISGGSLLFNFIVTLLSKS